MNPRAITDGGSFPRGIRSLRRGSILVSVRDAEEALAAIEGGADVVDVKEPSKGPLGRAELEQIVAITQVVRGRRPVTAAAGELCEWRPDDLVEWATRASVSLIKIGLAGLARADWRNNWAQLLALTADPRQLVPVAYADWAAADAPKPTEIAIFAADQGLEWILIDTFDKSAGGIRSILPDSLLQDFLNLCRELGLRVAVAGQLTANDLPTLCRWEPNLIGFRGAVCQAGRSSTVSAARVRGLVQAQKGLCRSPAS